MTDRGIGQAQTMSGHSMQTQTVDYVRDKREEDRRDALNSFQRRFRARGKNDRKSGCIR